MRTSPQLARRVGPRHVYSPRPLGRCGRGPPPAQREGRLVAGTGRPRLSESRCEGSTRTIAARRREPGRQRRPLRAMSWSRVTPLPTWLRTRRRNSLASVTLASIDNRRSVCLPRDTQVHRNGSTRRAPPHPAPQKYSPSSIEVSRAAF